PRTDCDRNNDKHREDGIADHDDRMAHAPRVATGKRHPFRFERCARAARRLSGWRTAVVAHLTRSRCQHSTTLVASTPPRRGKISTASHVRKNYGESLGRSPAQTPRQRNGGKS